MSTYMRCADVAKVLRMALKAAYGSTKFSVRSKTYSGGASIRVAWIDGPKVADVQAITSQFEGASFDGMCDLKTSNGALAALDGARSGADYIFTDRAYSDHEWRRVARDVADIYGLPYVPDRSECWQVDAGGRPFDIRVRECLAISVIPA